MKSILFYPLFMDLMYHKAWPYIHDSSQARDKNRYIIIIPNMAATSAMPDPILTASPWLVAVAEAADPVVEALEPDEALAPVEPAVPLAVSVAMTTDVVAPATLDASVLLAVYKAGG